MVSISLSISGILAIIIGILILAVPKLLRFGVGAYLIIVGILQVLGI